MRREVLATATAGALLAAGAAAAQDAPPLTSNDPVAALPQAQSAQTPMRTEQRPVAPASSASERTLILNSASFRGGEVLGADRLASVWRPYQGRAVTLDDLRAIALAAEDAYAEAGYPFVAVILPAQEVENGAVEFQVFEGRVSDLTVLGLDPVARRQATAAFQGLVDRRPLALRDVERAYEVAQDIPGLTLAGSLRRGSQAGGMDLVLQAQRDAWRAYANLNNLYPDPVGPFGLLLGAEHNGASLYGDRTTVQLYSTLDAEEQQVLRLSHARRINASGGQISLGLLLAEASPGGETRDIDLATNVFAGRLEGSYPLIARPTLGLSAALGYEHTDQETLIFSDEGLSEDRLRIVVARLFGEHNVEAATTRFDLQVRQGLRDFDASREGDLLLSRADANPQALVVRAELSGTIRPPLPLELGWRVEGQWSNESLTAPEEYSVGNLTVGRGYDPGAAYGDQAFAVSAEFRSRPLRPRLWLAVQPYVFVDAVEVWNKETLAPDGRTLTSVGIGARFDVRDRARLDVFYADGLDEPLGLGESDPDGMLYVNLTASLPELFRGAGRLTASRARQ